MNAVAILPQLVRKLLQTQNVKRNNVAILKPAEEIAPIQEIAKEAETAL
jgi:hypothetical protein